MTSIRARILPVFASFAIAAMALAGCGGNSSQVAVNPTAVPVPTTITVEKGQSFAPFILPVQPNTTITFVNHDSVPHNVKSSPAKDPLFLNLDTINLTVPVGGSQTKTLSKPGLYHYFDDTLGTWNTDDNRVQANQNTPSYPLAFEGVIWVQGPIVGLPITSTNSVISGKDDFANEFVAVSRGGTVTWHNYDTDKHYVQTATGMQAPLNPASVPLLTILGTDGAPPTGQTQTFTFSTPGLYYYFCTAHADVDPATHRVKAHVKTATQAQASEYPIPMEGFVLVG